MTVWCQKNTTAIDEIEGRYGCSINDSAHRDDCS